MIILARTIAVNDAPPRCPHELGDTSTRLSGACHRAESRLSDAEEQASHVVFVIKECGSGMLAVDEDEFVGMKLTIAELELENLQLRHRLADMGGA